MDERKPRPRIPGKTAGMIAAVAPPITITITPDSVNLCDHDWKDLPREESLSYRDKKCKLCGVRSMQAASALPVAFMSPVIESIALPVLEPIRVERDPELERYHKEVKRQLYGAMDWGTMKR